MYLTSDQTHNTYDNKESMVVLHSERRKYELL